MVRVSLAKMWDYVQKSEPVLELNIDLIKPNPYQPRSYFDPFHLAELAQSIQEFGVLQPIIVRRSQNHYELIVGERRLRAVQSIGGKTIPAIVKVISNQEAAEIALIENLQREDLNYFEEAEAYQKLIQEFNLTQAEVAYRVGKAPSTIANKLRLLNLPPEIRQKIKPPFITERHARALLKLADQENQARILAMIYEQSLNVRETEAEIKKTLKQKSGRIVRAITDLRIYVNTLKAALETIKEAGLKVEMAQQDKTDFVEIMVRIYKP